MTAVRISPAVRAAIGAANAAAIESGRVALEAAQCWRCGGPVQVAGAGHDSVALSVIVDDLPAAITLWSHPECSDSRVVTFAEFDASPAANMPSPVPPEDAAVIVDGVDRGRLDLP